MSKLSHLYIKEHISATFSGIQGAVPYAVASAITGETITIKYPVFLHKFVHFRIQRTIVSTVGSVTEVTRFNNRGWERLEHEPCCVIFFATCMLCVQRIHRIDSCYDEK